MFHLTNPSRMNSKSTIDPFYVVGISTRVRNGGDDGPKAIGELWARFYSEGVSEKITNPISQEIYSIYTDYETDYTGEYTTFIGVKVENLDEIPEGLEGKIIGGGVYEERTITGDPMKSIPEAWSMIWQEDAKLKRRYTSDFEVYGENSAPGPKAEVKIYLAVKS